MPRLDARRSILNPVHRYFFARNAIGSCKGMAKPSIRITIVRVIIDAQRSAIFQNYARRTFYLDREQVEGILSQQISSFWPSSAPASMAPRS